MQSDTNVITSDEAIHCNFLNKLTKIFSKEEKIQEYFEHIRENWKEQYYIDALQMWNQIQTFRSEQETPYQCRCCETYWKNQKFIGKNINPFHLSGDICGCCDTFNNPYLCNPINAKYVLKYIDTEYYPFIFPIYNKFKDLEDPLLIFQYSKKEKQLEDVLLCIKERNKYGVSVRLYLRDGDEYMRLFVNLSKSPYWITTFSKGRKGIIEKIYYDRTEYYINGKYYSNEIDYNLNKILEKINNMFFDLSIFSIFIEKQIEIGEKQLCLFSLDKLEEVFDDNHIFDLISLLYLRHL
jgi:hypothetical protein